MALVSSLFSFQIAFRSAQLEPSIPAPWIDVLLDSFPDLVASKMIALVEWGRRGISGIFIPLCRSGLTTPQECWELWRRRQQLSGGDMDSTRARLAVETHLLRQWHGLPRLPYLGSPMPHIRDDPNLEFV
jgi:hypothetical protein